MRSVVRGTLALGLSLLCSAGASHAAGTPASLCAAAKLKAAGKLAASSLACHSKAAKRGTAADGACLAKAHDKEGLAFSQAEARGGCATAGDASTIAATVDSSVGAFVAALRPSQSANGCAAAKLKATGKKAKRKLVCHAKAGRHGLAVDPSCLAKAETKFASGFAAAEAHGPCLTNGDAPTIEAGVDDLVTDLTESIPDTTTTTTAGPACGNGTVEAGEQCDTNPEPICVSAGRGGCLPASDPNACQCCTLPGGTGVVDPLGSNLCCDGSAPTPGGPGAYLCP